MYQINYQTTIITHQPVGVKVKLVKENYLKYSLTVA